MRILALDAATEACSVALWIDGSCIERSIDSGKGHAQQLLRMVTEVLSEASLPLTAVDALAASIGPGAFTGVRISVAVAQGLAFGACLPVVPVSTLEALAMQVVSETAGALACLDAPGAVILPSAGRYTGIGRGLDAHPLLRELPNLQSSDSLARALPQAREFARLGALRVATSARDPAQLEPMYLRDKVAFTEAERLAAKPVA